MLSRMTAPTIRTTVTAVMIPKTLTQTRSLSSVVSFTPSGAVFCLFSRTVRAMRQPRKIRRETTGVHRIGWVRKNYANSFDYRIVVAGSWENFGAGAKS